MQALLPLEVISPPSVGEEERPLNWMEKLEAARAEAAVCTRCALHCGRTHSVFSDGNPNAKPDADWGRAGAK